MLARLLTATFFATLLLAPFGGPAGAQTEEEPIEAQAQGRRKFRVQQERPIKLGTSGGSSRDRTVFSESIACCSGTLGALVEKNGLLHVLSNNHVIARSNKANRGEAIIQSGYLDQTPICQVPPETETVANLSAYKKIRFGGSKRNRVDAAIAEIIPGKVDPTGRLLQIGIPGSVAVDPALGMQVKKVGRSTGLTRGVIWSVDAVVNVTYEQGCGTDIEKTARFVDQIAIIGNNRRFSRGGDSGSMIVRDVSNCPAPVGLLFAGGTLSNGVPVTIASPMKIVQRQLGNRPPRGDVNLVGCEQSTSATEVPAQDASQQVMDDPELKFAQRLLARKKHQLMSSTAVFGVGVSLASSGPAEPVLHIYVDKDKPESWSELPLEIEGVRTEIVPTGPFVAYCNDRHTDVYD